MFKLRINYFKKSEKRVSYKIIGTKELYTKLEWFAPLVLSKKALDKLCLILGSEENFKE